MCVLPRPGLCPFLFESYINVIGVGFVSKGWELTEIMRFEVSPSCTAKSFLIQKNIEPPFVLPSVLFSIT